jgi:hypothetical protein
VRKDIDVADHSDRFCLNLYRWALRDFDREIAEGFPLLNIYPYWDGKLFVDCFHQLTLDNKSMMPVALVKRFHSLAARIGGDTIAEREKELIDRFSLSLKNAHFQMVDNLVKPKLSRTVIVRRIQETVRGTIGGNIESLGNAGTWLHSTVLGNWRVSTTFDVRSNRVYFGHRIFDLSQDLNLLPGYISILSWFGILSSTEFYLTSRQDIDALCDSVNKLCAHFVSSVPILQKE